MALEQSTHMNQLLTDIEQHHNENEIKQMARNGMCYKEMTMNVCERYVGIEKNFADKYWLKMSTLSIPRSIKVPSAKNKILAKPIEEKE